MLRKLTVPILLMIIPGVAMATLGDDVSSINQDRIVLQQSSFNVNQRQNLSELSNTNSNANYTLSTIPVKGGQIREYININTQRVFAVSWEAERVPNLKQLLGSRYLEQFQSFNATKVNRTQSAISQPDFLANYGGGFGHHYGKVIVTSEMPQNVSFGEIK